MKKYFLFALLLQFSVLKSTAQLTKVDYQDGTQKLNGIACVAKKTSKTKPGVLILPAWKGIDKHAKDSAEMLAKLGYTAFIADIYGEGNYPTNTQEAGKQAGFYKKNVADYQRRITLALNELIKSGANPDNIVVIGYCFGGTGVLEVARSGMNVKGVVSFHGGLGKDSSRAATPVNTRVLVLHGADDKYVSNAEIESFQQEMREAKADWEMIYYANSVHAFTDPEAGNDNSKGAAYNEKADKRSWERMKAFMKDVFL
jgi:dienelactone hydrolase